MEAEEIAIYRNLQKHLDELPVGFPPTKSGVELKLLKYLFTLEEAKIATKLSFTYEPIKIIYNRVKESNISITELELLLENLVSKGTIHYKKDSDEKLYANAMLVIGIFEYQVNKLTMEFMDLMKQYGQEAFDVEMFRTRTSQTRIIPVEKSLTHENIIETYSNVRNIIRNAEEPLAITNCVCRQKQDVRREKDPCKLTDRYETCLGFGHSAQMYIDQGWARQVTKEEALDILDKNEETGLILQPGNAIRPDFICSCCGCCCGLLRDLKKMNNPARLMKTNYVVEVDSELCTGCGVCVDRCQMGALSIVDDISSVNRKKCLGCGLCVVTCPSEAINLSNKEKESSPPKTTDELNALILSKKKELIDKYNKSKN
ncbi:MAG: 4Fe-4S binding protein [Candidatus Lokiarchaeota archaeon]|nr:4Fe-4S binding protein [Candidatus Lokiarchaeota archaeon]